jgi:phage terminase small subunit
MLSFFRDPRREAFAQALAENPHRMNALVKAGYSGNSRNTAHRLAKSPEMIDRVAAIRSEALQATSVEGLVKALMVLADKAAALGTETAMGVARGLLSDATRLRMVTEKRASATSVVEAADDDWTPRPYTEAEKSVLCLPAR